MFDLNMSDSEQDELLQQLLLELNSAILDEQQARFQLFNSLKTNQLIVPNQ